MADKKAEEQKKAKKKLLLQIDIALELMGPAMGGSYDARDACKTVKGDSLYERVIKCKAVIKVWEKDIKALDKGVDTLVKTMNEAYPKTEKDRGGSVSIAQSVRNLAENRAHVMRQKMEAFKSHVKVYEAELKKVKVK